MNTVIRGEELVRSTVSDLLDDAVPKKDTVGTARPVEADPLPDAGLGDGTLPQPG